MSQIILRIRSPQGQNRLSINIRDLYSQFLNKLSKTLNHDINDLIIMTQDNRIINIQQNKKISDVSYFQDGVIIKVDIKPSGLKKKNNQNNQSNPVQDIKKIDTSKCNHPPNGKCLNCMTTQDKDKKDDKKQTQSKAKCNHGPFGKCLNCTQVDPKDKTQKMKLLCQHGPNGKCVHCLDKQFISDAAHISFDNYLQQKKLKCKGVHPSDVKCNNCLPPSQIRYQVDTKCKNHQPYPKAMCNKCIPPNVVVKRQQYRHVDYVQFMNTTQIQDFVSYWVQKKKTAQQRVGYLYGYYAEDPNYKGGIRVIVQAIYQPEQVGTYSDFTIKEKLQKTLRADNIANGLSLERVGWIYTENNNDTIMDQKKIRMAAQLQEQYKVRHSSGYQISNFVTVILRSDEKNLGEIKPQVYMISDQGQALQRHNLFDNSNTRKLVKVKVAQNNKQAYPSFIVGGKTVNEFQTQFLLVKIAHGTSKSNKFAILKKSQFPPINREKPSKTVLKEYIKRNKHKPTNLKYGDFNFLLYLSQILDIQTAMVICEQVESQGTVNQHVQQLIEHTADL